MCDNTLAFHYVCTHDQAGDLIQQHEQFWISNCGCSEPRGGCQRARLERCLYFREDGVISGTGKHPASRAEVIAIFAEAEDNHLVTRPFRDEMDKSKTDGICFCCDDCCDYFVSPTASRCDKGSFVEKTDTVRCSACGTCTDVCYFNARALDDSTLIIQHDLCYGCGLCVQVCPEGCIAMV